MKTNQTTAEEIVNYFMSKGATVSKADYDYVISLLSAKDKAVVEMIEKLPTYMKVLGKGLNGEPAILKSDLLTHLTNKE